MQRNPNLNSAESSLLTFFQESLKKIKKLKKNKKDLRKYRVLYKAALLNKGAAFCIPQGFAPDDLTAGLHQSVAG